MTSAHQSELPALGYLVRVRLIEGHDWRTPPSSDDDGPAGDSDDSNDPDWLDRGQRGRSMSRPRRFGGANNDGNRTGGGEANEPRLRPGWGPTFRSNQAMIVGTFHCTVRETTGGWSVGRKAKKHSLSSAPQVTMAADHIAVSSGEPAAPAEQLQFEFGVHCQPAIASTSHIRPVVPRPC